MQTHHNNSFKYIFLKNTKYHIFVLILTYYNHKGNKASFYVYIYIYIFLNLTNKNFKRKNLMLNLYFTCTFLFLYRKVIFHKFIKKRLKKWEVIIMMKFETDLFEIDAYRPLILL